MNSKGSWFARTQQKKRVLEFVWTHLVDTLFTFNKMNKMKNLNNKKIAEMDKEQEALIQIFVEEREQRHSK